MLRVRTLGVDLLRRNVKKWEESPRMYLGKFTTEELRNEPGMARHRVPEKVECHEVDVTMSAPPRDGGPHVH